MRKFVLLSTILFATPFAMECQAANCATTDCYELGYTLTSKSDNCLQCPFSNYWFCPQDEESSSGSCDSSYKYTCTGTNQSPTGKNCNGKYKTCLCTSGYSWVDGSCQPVRFCGHIQTYTSYTLDRQCTSPSAPYMPIMINDEKICISNDGTQSFVIESKKTQYERFTISECHDYIQIKDGKLNVVDTAETCCVTSDYNVTQ